MESIKNSAAELNGNQRTWRSCREVAEDGGGSRGNGDTTEIRVGMERSGLRARGLQGRKFGKIKRRRGRKRLDGRDGGEGQERASVTTFWEPGRWTRLLVNSKMNDRCLC